MNKDIKDLLNQCRYALGEAIINAELLAEVEVRGDAKYAYDEDLELFNSLRESILRVVGDHDD